MKILDQMREGKDVFKVVFRSGNGLIQALVPVNKLAIPIPDIKFVPLEKAEAVEMQFQQIDKKGGMGARVYEMDNTRWIHVDSIASISLLDKESLEYKDMLSLLERVEADKNGISLPNKKEIVIAS